MFNILLLDTGCCAWLACPWWLLWTLGAFLLGALLYWWLFCRGKQQQIDELTVERDGYHAQFTNAEKDLASLKYQLDEANKENARLKAALNSCEADKSILKAQIEAGGAADAAGGGGKTALGFAGGVPEGRDGTNIDYAAILGKTNLQIVEGVGPKIEKLLKEGGIGSWSALALTSVDRLQEILDAAGKNYRLADPKTWPNQAKLADENKWDELIEYQKFLDTGKDNKGDGETPSKIEKLLAKLLGFNTNPNDLKIVEGVGPKIEGLLKDAGINNWAELAATTVDRLREILAAAGDRYRLANPETWPEQARLADAGAWSQLKEYQDFLSGGRNPG